MDALRCTAGADRTQGRRRAPCSPARGRDHVSAGLTPRTDASRTASEPGTKKGTSCRPTRWSSLACRVRASATPPPRSRQKPTHQTAKGSHTGAPALTDCGAGGVGAAGCLASLAVSSTDDERVREPRRRPLDADFGGSELGAAAVAIAFDSCFSPAGVSGRHCSRCPRDRSNTGNSSPRGSVPLSVPVEMCCMQLAGRHS
jgi:hypothetical protein